MQKERQFRNIKELLRAVTRGLDQKTWNKWLGAVTFAINANVNRVTGLTSFYLMYRREPTIPVYTIVGLPQPEALEPQDFDRTRALAMARNLVIAQENYETYYRRAAATYTARSPIGEPPHLDKLVWA